MNLDLIKLDPKISIDSCKDESNLTTGRDGASNKVEEPEERRERGGDKADRTKGRV